MGKIVQERQDYQFGHKVGEKENPSQKDPISGDYPRVDNSNPEPSLKFLLPVALSPISVSRLDEPLTTDKLLRDAARLGFEIDHFDLNIYKGLSKYGRMRLHSNAELVSHYGPLYGPSSSPLGNRLKILMEMRNKAIPFIKSLVKHAESLGPIILGDEQDDAERTTNQRTAFYGRCFVLPASEDIIGLQYPKRFLEICQIVAQHYIRTTEDKCPTRLEAMASITDAKETSVGAPSFASAGEDEGGHDYHAKRLITLADCPIPTYDLDPIHWLSSCYDWGEQLGLPDGSMAFASSISYRQGAKGHKAQPLWFPTDNGFSATYEGMSMESNQRLVYPAPHSLNVVLSPMVYQMKLFRKLKLGLFHDPEHYLAYIPKLNQQGSFAYENDFSGYDRTISNSIMKYVCRLLSSYSKKYSWEYKLFSDFLDSTGVISPSYISPTPGLVTYMKGAVSLLSGILPTSEIGSFISVCANLYALEGEFPDIVNQWISGKFIMLIQSDDVCFTFHTKINEEQFSDRMKQIGLKAKLKEGYMFLKKLLPIGALAKFQRSFPIGGVPLMSRATVQQTLHNENDLDGKPGAIIRLGIKSRSFGLNRSPVFSQQLDDDWKHILSDFPVFNEALPTLYDGVLSLSEEDKLEILKYSSSTEGLAWVSQLINRQTADPKAALMVQELAKLGFNLDEYDDTALEQRRSYMNALFRNPDNASRDSMISICVWAHDRS